MIYLVLEILKISFFTLQVALLFFWTYWFAVSLYGIGKEKKRKNAKPKSRFLILIPAHNEENVIGNLVDNLNELDYDKDLYTVCVIADNCTDKTYDICKGKGALVLRHQSKPGELKGKPYAIKYAFEVLEDELHRFDAFCVFDADNLVTKNYLKEMNDHLVKGDKLIQCYLDTKNPDDNWISTAYATSYYYMNRSWQLAKSRVGLGNAIGGTGFCASIDILKTVGWNATSLTEDLEFQIQCLLRDVPAKWSHHAKVFDEKPLKLKDSSVQRLRWARGHWDVCYRYTWELLKKTVKDFDFLAFDGFMYLINPGKIVIGSLSTLVIVLQSWFSNVKWFNALVPTEVWITLFVFQLLYISYCVLADSKTKIWQVIKSMAYLPIFNYIYVPLFMWAFITKENRTWVRTEHTRSISSTDRTEADSGLGV